jgi:uncharacterized cupin superfamily protein
MPAPPSAVNAQGVTEPFDIKDVPWQEANRGDRFGMKFQVLSEFAGGKQITVCMEILPPGKQANQKHYHLLEEEHVMVLEGSMTVLLGDRAHEISAGQYICFPAGQKIGHALVNRTGEPCRYLVFGNPQPHDVMVFTDTGRVSVRLTGESYRGSATMDYWEGVRTT